MFWYGFLIGWLSFPFTIFFGFAVYLAVNYFRQERMQKKMVWQKELMFEAFKSINHMEVE